MLQYATVEEYREDTGDKTSDAVRVNAMLKQQSAKLRAHCGITASETLSEDASELARLLVTDAVRKALTQTVLDGLGDVVGVKQAGFSVNGFQSNITLSNPSGSAYFDTNTLKAFKKLLRRGARAGFVYLGGA